MKKRWLVGVALWLLAAWVQAAPGGIPYRMLWHAYRLGMGAADAESRLTITSANGVDPRTFLFTPADAEGRSVLVCDEGGLCTVRWDPQFYEANTLIYSNQPKGTLKLSVGWSFTYNSNLPVGVFLAIHGRNYVESAYHWAMLSQVMSRG